MGSLAVLVTLSWYNTVVCAWAVLINMMACSFRRHLNFVPRHQCVIYRPNFEKHGSAHLALFSVILFSFCKEINFIRIYYKESSFINKELSLLRRLETSLLRSSRDLLCCTSSFSISILDLLF